MKTKDSLRPRIRTARRALCVTILAGVAMVLTTGNLSAQTVYSVNIVGLYNGGGTSASGGYTFTHTSGQTVQGNVSGGSYSAQLGFWPQVMATTQPATADLAVTIGSLPAQIQEGDLLTIPIAVSNLGPDMATGVQLNTRLPAGTVVQSIHSTAGTCQMPSETNIVCTANSLGAQQSFTIEIVGGGSEIWDMGDEFTLTFAATATATGSDPNPTNNSVAAVVNVIPKLDFGDARLGYPVTRAENGARHRNGAVFHLGANFDREPNGVHSALADGDDLAGGPDDEDGVTIPSPLLAGGTYNVMVNASVAGFLDVFFDFNNDGDWNDPGERVTPSAGLAIGPGPAPLAVTVPLTAAAGNPHTRFRFSDVGGLAPTGFHPVGEVEDHQIEIRRVDFGDAPEAGTTFEVTLARNGARHIASPLRLGNNVDWEPDGQPNVGATLDDTTGVLDDEDGVVMPAGGFTPGTVPTVQVTVIGGGGILDAWFDWDNNLNWDASERSIAGYVIPAAGVYNVPVTVPPGIPAGQRYARFRLSTAGSATTTGPATDGEVEDYAQIVVNAPSPPLLSMMSSNNQLVLSWTEPNAILEYSQNITGPWVPVVGAASPYMVILPTANAGSSSGLSPNDDYYVPETPPNRRFYRLRVPPPPAPTVRPADVAPQPQLQEAVRAFKRQDHDASFSFFNGHVDNFATRAKRAVPAYAVPVLQSLGLSTTARQPRLMTGFVHAARSPRPSRNLDATPDVALPFPVESDDGSRPVSSGESDPTDDLQGQTPPPVELRHLPAENPQRPLDWDRPSDQQLQLERQAATPILQNFLALHPDVFDVNPSEFAAAMSFVKYQVGAYFRKAQYEQYYSAEEKILYGKTLVLFDVNWNVILISRMITTPSKLPVPALNSGITQTQAVQTAMSGSPACQALGLEVLRAERCVDPARRLRVWDVELRSVDGQCHWRSIVDAASGTLLNVSDLIAEAYNDAKVNRWKFSDGNFKIPSQTISTSIYTRNDRRLEHDFFYVMNDHRCEGDPEQTCNETGFACTWCAEAHGSYSGDSYVRATRRPDRDWSGFTPGGGSETFAEGHTYYWARSFAQWLKNSLDALGVLPNSAADYERVLILTDTCDAGTSYNSSYKVSTDDNKGEGSFVIRLAHRDPSGSANNYKTCQGGGCFETPSHIHHELNHFFLHRYIDVGQDWDCGGANELKLTHEGILGSVMPQAFWNSYYGVGYAPDTTDKLYLSDVDAGRVHTDRDDKLGMEDFVCGTTGDPYGAGRVVGQALWEIYHGRLIGGEPDEYTWRPATDDDFNTLVYWAAELQAGSTYKDRYEFANRIIEIVSKHSDLSSAGVADWCSIFEHHSLQTFINTNYCKDLVFDINFVVLTTNDAAPTHISVITDPSTGTSYTGAEIFPREVEILNTYFVDEDGDAVSHDGYTIRFRHKSHYFYRDIRDSACELLEFGDQKDRKYLDDTYSSYVTNVWTAMDDAMQKCNDTRLRDPFAINFYIYDCYKWNTSSGGFADSSDKTSHGSRNSAEVSGDTIYMPLVVLDVARLLHQTQSPEEHEMGHAFSLDHVCDPSVTGVTDDSNIMGSTNCDPDCSSCTSGGARNLGFTEDQVKQIVGQALATRASWRPE